MVDCSHNNVKGDVLDQTLGVFCVDCNTWLAWCWMEDHLPESLWNRACINDKDLYPCTDNRDDYCAICEQQIKS